MKVTTLFNFDCCCECGGPFGSNVKGDLVRHSYTPPKGQHREFCSPACLNRYRSRYIAAVGHSGPSFNGN